MEHYSHTKLVVKFVRQLITGFRMPYNLKIIPEKEPLQITPMSFYVELVPVLKNNNSAIMVCIDISSRINY